MQKLWIIGAGGLVGKTLTKICREKNLHFLATTRQEVDITDLAAVRSYAKKSGATHLINCAAWTDVDGAEKKQEEAFAINGKAPGYLAQVAQEEGIRLLHLSTDYVFGGSSSHPYHETDRCAPLSVYGKSKWEGEKNVFLFHPSACVIRTAWVYGQGKGNFVLTLLKKMEKEENVLVIEDQRGSPTCCKDLAYVLLAMLDKEGLFHFVNKGDPSRYEVAQEILTHSSSFSSRLKCQRVYPISRKEFSYIAERPAYSALSIDKIESILDFPIRNWKEALLDFLQEISP